MLSLSHLFLVSRAICSFEQISLVSASNSVSMMFTISSSSRFWNSVPDFQTACSRTAIARLFSVTRSSLSITSGLNTTRFCTFSAFSDFLISGVLKPSGYSFSFSVSFSGLCTSLMLLGRFSSPSVAWLALIQNSIAALLRM